MNETKWISVSTRMPRVGQWIWAFSHSEGNFAPQCVVYTPSFMGFTHWCPVEAA